MGFNNGVIVRPASSMAGLTSATSSGGARASKRDKAQPWHPIAKCLSDAYGGIALCG